MEIRSERCNHCDNPPCVTCCPTGASHVSDFGIRCKVTANRCIGCKACIAACPYGARFVHPKGYVDKCTFCDHRVKDGKDPACVSVCPTHCMHFGDLDDPKSSVRHAAAHPQVAHAAARGRNAAAGLLPDVRERAMLELTTTRHNPWHRPEPARLGLGDPALPVRRRHGRRHDDPRGHRDAAHRQGRGHEVVLLDPDAAARLHAAQRRHAGAAARPGAPALRVGRLHHVRADVADVLGLVGPARRLRRAAGIGADPAAGRRGPGSAERVPLLQKALRLHRGASWPDAGAGWGSNIVLRRRCSASTPASCSTRWSRGHSWNTTILPRCSWSPDCRRRQPRCIWPRSSSRAGRRPAA